MKNKVCQKLHLSNDENLNEIYDIPVTQSFLYIGPFRGYISRIWLPSTATISNFVTQKEVTSDPYFKHHKIVLTLDNYKKYVKLTRHWKE